MNISSFDMPISIYLSPLVTWLASEGAETFVNGGPITAVWGVALVLTGLAASMVVNALVTGLIAFKILKVFLQVKATSVERTLGSLSSTGGPKLRQIIFIIIESGMALFAIQLVRVVISIILLQLEGEQSQQTPISLQITLDFVIAIHEMLNVIIISVSFSTNFFY